ncbi:MAG TPA: hypothetical protein VM936_18585 [Pyrinomonadaceae bacterium]|jgi:hypothetical protein|nr:hypothetical protein [Pyrinomonadaceae bacterium]
MYCQHCGAESTQGLNYCKRCGGNLGALVQAPPQEVAQNLPTGTVRTVGFTLIGTVVFGLGILTALITELVHSGVRPEPLVMIMMCGSLTILGSVFMLTRFWMHMLGKSRTPDTPRVYAPAAHANDLGPAPQRFGALNDAPASSVTEHTTRTLEHAKRK